MSEIKVEFIHRTANRLVFGKRVVSTPKEAKQFCEYMEKFVKENKLKKLVEEDKKKHPYHYLNPGDGII